MTVSPEQRHPGKELLEWLKQLLGTTEIRIAGCCDFHLHQVALGIDEHMSFASPDPFSHVEAFFGPANGTGFDRLAINHRSTGLFVSAFFLPHLFEKAFLNLIPDALLAPPPKVVIQRPPGWQVM